jgi:hypothetical protein
MIFILHFNVNVTLCKLDECVTVREGKRGRGMEGYIHMGEEEKEGERKRDTLRKNEGKR